MDDLRGVDSNKVVNLDAFRGELAIDRWGPEKRNELLAVAAQVSDLANRYTHYQLEIALDVTEEGHLSLIVTSGANDYLIVPYEPKPGTWSCIRNSPEIGMKVLIEGVPLEQALITQ